MNAAELTTTVAAIGAVAASFCVPIYLQRRKERQQAGAVAATNARRLAESSEVSWEKINLAIAKERDNAQEQLAKQASTHTAEIAAMRDRHASEIGEMRSSWERTNADMSRRITEYQQQVARLYQELYELHRLLPPGVNPPRLSPPGE